MLFQKEPELKIGCEPFNILLGKCCKPVIEKSAEISVLFFIWLRYNLTDCHDFTIFGQRPQFVVDDQFEFVDVVPDTVEISLYLL